MATPQPLVSFVHEQTAQIAALKRKAETGLPFDELILIVDQVQNLEVELFERVRSQFEHSLSFIRDRQTPRMQLVALREFVCLLLKQLFPELSDNERDELLLTLVDPIEELKQFLK